MDFNLKIQSKIKEYIVITILTSITSVVVEASQVDVLKDPSARDPKRYATIKTSKALKVYLMNGSFGMIYI